MAALFQISAQEINGTYLCDDQYLIFNGCNVEYSLTTGGGASTIFRGKGTFKINGDYLLIKPDINTSQKFNQIETISSLNNDTLTIINANHDTIPILIRFMEHRKTVYMQLTEPGQDGKVLRSQIIKCDSLNVGMFGYQSIGIGIKNDSDCLIDYKISLAAFDVTDIHYHFVTNNEKGFKFRLKSDGLD